MARRWAAPLAALVAVAATTAGTAWWSAHRHHSDPATNAVPVATATVVRTDLATTTELSGTLGYAGSYSLAAQGTGGTITALPQPGQVVRRGQPGYEIDGAPVYLFYGARPAWRTLTDGVPPGPDVAQLEQNLTALGYADAADLTVDSTFTVATSWAIRRWQLATGQAVTGQVTLGTVTFEPGPIRVLTVPGTLGSTTAPAQTLVTATSPTPVITVPVPAAQTYLVHPGDAVTVTLPAGTATPGRIESVSSVAVGGQGNSGGSGGGSGSGGGGGGGGGSSPNGPGQASVPAVVALTHPGAVAHLDQAPVTVNITDRRVTGVLAVPITALVALAGGGYGVYVDGGGSGGGGGRHLVPVTPGLFATSLVQVAGNGLHVGDTVEVPAP